MYPIIAISGKYGTGKDTLTALICAHLERAFIPFVHAKFADGLKHAVAAILHMPTEDMYSDEGKSQPVAWLNGMTVGRVQQLVGTVLREQIQSDIWVAPVIAQAKEGRVLIISDCRFPNEVQAVQDRGGIVIRLNRKSASLYANGRDPTHISETILDLCDRFDLVIDNDGTVEDMWEKVASFLELKKSVE
jgi:dephospho-CoA kinase